MYSSICQKDDYLHAPGDKLDWRESYYFNFVSRSTKTSGFTTIGLNPNKKTQEFMLALVNEDKQTIYYKEQPMQADLKSQEFISDRILTYELIKPMEKWDIKLKNEAIDLSLHWNARFPPFDFGKGSQTSWDSHFEQSGTIQGTAKLLEGTEIVIEGLSQRDKSWGQRNWHIEKWFALHAQLKDSAIGLRRDTVKGTHYVSGGLASESNQVAASQVDLEIIYDGAQTQNPVGCLTKIKYANGQRMSLKSKLISSKSMVKFSRDFAQGSTDLFEGLATHEDVETGEKATGLIEFLFTHTKTGKAH
ncbi:MAG TPA: hypothetical protein VMD05_01470 [Candidatus Nanoarchaeia archaeon]|nr:hypothetical protein [Candidatus Nanoarchaeia archaeon]